MINNHSRATTAGPGMRGFKQEFDGRQRADKNDCQRQRRKEHPYCSFNRYNNLIGSRHVKLRPGCQLNSPRVCT